MARTIRNETNTREALRLYNVIMNKDQAPTPDALSMIDATIEGLTLDEVRETLEALKDRGLPFKSIFTRSAFMTYRDLLNRGAEPAKPATAETPQESDLIKALRAVTKGNESAMNEDRVREIAREECAGREVPSIVKWTAPKGETRTETTHKRYTYVRASLENATDKWPLLVGPAGSGKSYLARQIARTMGAEYYETGAVLSAYDLLGFNDAQGRYVETEFYRACKSASEGNKVLFCLDEMDASDPRELLPFNNAMSSLTLAFPCGRLEFENLMFIACANTWGEGASAEYVGRNVIDKATLNRFAPVVIGYDPSIEAVKCPDKDLLETLRAFRKACTDADLHRIISYRDLSYLYAMVATCKDKEIKETAIDGVLLGGLSRDEAGYILPALPDNEYSQLISARARKLG